MKSNPRFVELMSGLLDDAITEDEVAELSSMLRSDPLLRSQLVDHLLLDTLLDENLGQEPLTALVDLIGNESTNHLQLAKFADARQQEVCLIHSSIPHLWLRAQPLGWFVIASCLVLAATLFFLQGEREAFASATQVVQAAMHTHAEAIERVYVVEVKRGETGNSRLQLPRDVRVATQGDRFWVQMNGYRKWAWGRDAEGAIWMTLGQHRAVVVNPDEMGSPLHYIGDLYSLHLETLLHNFLRHCRLEMSEGPGNTNLIVAVPRRQWSHRPLRSATIEVDRETKTIRKLIIEREFEGSSSIATFTLVDSRLADELLYRPEGHLSEPFRIFSLETNAGRRRELISSWFGPVAEQWMQILEKKSNE
jgi:hypothetical protein